MANYTMEYSKERGTWNIFNGFEWYAEGTYDQMCAMMDICTEYDDDEIIELGDYDDYPEDEYEEEEEYTPSSTRGDYGPSNPWDAPGMSISDFI